MTNPTAQKFGYPKTLVAETDRWLVLVRPSQPTYGALVLVCKEAAQSFADLSPQAFAELGTVVGGVERLLSALVRYERINYLMLMMVDRDVHFHVIPRYDGVRQDGGQSYPDTGWPGPPALSPAVDLDAERAAAFASRLAAQWS